MRRYLLPLLAAALAASCSPGIDGVTCSTSIDCPERSHCDQGVCINDLVCRMDSQCDTGQVCRNGACIDRSTLECMPACQGLTECIAGSCIRSFTSLAIELPLSGASVGNAFTLRATLARVPEGAANPPAALRVSARDSLGTTSQLADLPLVSGTTYETPTARLPAEGAYEVTVSVGDPAYPDLADTVSLRAERPPAIAVTVSAPPPRPPSSWTFLGDPAAGYENAWIKDEKPVVRVFSSDTNIQSATAWADLGNDRLEIQLPRTCTGYAFCREGDADLASFRMNALRATFQVTAIATTTAAIQGISTAVPLPVTRVKWIYALGTGELPTAPAIGPTGTVFVGTRGPVGGVHAVRASGERLWVHASGPVAAPVAVVAAVPEVVGIATAGDATGVGGGLRLIPSAEPTSFLECEPPDGVGVKLKAMTVLASGAARALVGIGESSSGQAGFLTLVASVTPECHSQLGLLDAGLSENGGLVSNGSALYWGDSAGALQAATYSDATGTISRQLTNGLPVALGGAPGAPILAQSSLYVGVHATSGDGIVRAFEAGCDSGGCPTLETDPVGALVEAPSGVIAATMPSGIKFSTPAFEDHGELLLAGGGGSTPALGAGGLLYVPGASGGLHVLDLGSRQRVWGVAGELAPLASAAAAPALDCARGEDGLARAGRPGTLYLATAAGKLVALVVDSRGLGVGSGWPKLLRDPRNTGNASFSLSEFSCP